MNTNDEVKRRLEALAVELFTYAQDLAGSDAEDSETLRWAKEEMRKAGIK